MHSQIPRKFLNIDFHSAVAYLSAFLQSLRAVSPPDRLMHRSQEDKT